MDCLRTQSVYAGGRSGGSALDELDELLLDRLELLELDEPGAQRLLEDGDELLDCAGGGGAGAGGHGGGQGAHPE